MCCVHLFGSTSTRAYASVAFALYPLVSIFLLTNAFTLPFTVALFLCWYLARLSYSFSLTLSLVLLWPACMTPLLVLAISVDTDNIDVTDEAAKVLRVGHIINSRPLCGA